MAEHHSAPMQRLQLDEGTPLI